MLDWLYLWNAGLVAVIVVFFVRAVRLTKASITAAAPSVPFLQLGALERAVDRLQTRCGSETVIVLGTRDGRGVDGPSLVPLIHIVLCSSRYSIRGFRMLQPNTTAQPQRSRS